MKITTYFPDIPLKTLSNYRTANRRFPLLEPHTHLMHIVCECDGHKIQDHSYPSQYQLNNTTKVFSFLAYVVTSHLNYFQMIFMPRNLSSKSFWKIFKIYKSFEIYIIYKNTQRDFSEEYFLQFWMQKRLEIAILSFISHYQIWRIFSYVLRSKGIFLDFYMRNISS